MTELCVLVQDKPLLSRFLCLIGGSLYVSTMDICAIIKQCHDSDLPEIWKTCKAWKIRNVYASY